MKESTAVSVVKEAPAVVEAPKVARVTRKVTPATLKKIVVIGKKAHEEVGKLPIAKALEADANAGIAFVRSLLPPKQEGKLSRLGHGMHGQCGQLDEAILSCEKADVGEWMKHVAKANCETRKSSAEDNQALAKWLFAHIKALSGTTPNVFKKRLARVQLADKAEEIQNGFAAVELWYKEHLNAAKF